MMCEKDSDTEA